MRQILFIALVFSMLTYSCSTKKTDTLVVISTKNLLATYKNTKIGNRKYRGKVLLVEGTIAEYYRNKKQEISIVLRDKNQLAGVKCNLIRSSRQIKKPLKYGQKIKIKGICIGFKENVILENCFIVKDK
ncbi:MAG: hypothetical protein B6I20_12080 [Bacteroidetes bacterium 4572_117]|nr:MAG: hypothetical protein B6I20_12080 [Bacteroidetes bacterium 4572_117]